MAKADFTFDEMVYNQNLVGKKIYYDGDGDEIEELKTIKYVKVIKATRQLQVHCEPTAEQLSNEEEGDVFLANQDDVFTFFVNNKKKKRKPNRKKQKGKNRRKN